MFTSIHACPLPENALLRRFLDSGDYTDCFVAHVDAEVSFPDFVESFYTTAIFKVERLILQSVFSLPSSDADAGQLARGNIDAFAAWTVLQRTGVQLLLMDIRGRTCSWLMAAPDSTGSQLYFGSAIIRSEKTPAGRRMKWRYRWLLGLHRFYSRVLLSAARSRLRSRRN